MPKITALIHTRNDALRLGRALESLRPCDEVLVVDDASDDDTVKVAHQYGAYVKTAIPGVTPGAYAMDASYDWVLCIEPNEALSEGLEASLIEWKEPGASGDAFLLQGRGAGGEPGWLAKPQSRSAPDQPQTRQLAGQTAR